MNAFHFSQFTLRTFCVMTAIFLYFSRFARPFSNAALYFSVSGCFFLDISSSISFIFSCVSRFIPRLTHAHTHTDTDTHTKIIQYVQQLNCGKKCDCNIIVLFHCKQTIIPSLFFCISVISSWRSLDSCWQKHTSWFLSDKNSYLHYLNKVILL